MALAAKECLQKLSPFPRSVQKPLNAKECLQKLVAVLVEQCLEPAAGVGFSLRSEVGNPQSTSCH